MNVIVAGSRDFNDYQLCRESLDNFFMTVIHESEQDIAIVCGMARGADMMGKWYADENGIQVIEMPADWDSYGKGAGAIRNAEMAKIGTHLIVFWDGKSVGTEHMMTIARHRKIPTTVIKYSERQNGTSTNIWPIVTEDE